MAYSLMVEHLMLDCWSYRIFLGEVHAVSGA